MVKNERWGHPYIDIRDWSTYNERLVRRGEFYLIGVTQNPTWFKLLPVQYI